MAAEEVKNISLQRIPDGAHSQYIEYTLKWARENAWIVSNLAVELAELDEARTACERALGRSRKSRLTEQIALHDRLRDGYFMGYKVVVKGFRRFPSSEKRQMAERLWQHIQAANISPRMQLDRQTGQLMIFTDALFQKYAAELEGLGLTLFAQKLKEENDLVDALLTERDIEDSKKVLGQMKKARKKAFAAYHQLIRKVNAHIVLDEAEDCRSFVSTMNTLIERYKEEVIKKPKKKEEGEKE